MAWEIVAIWIVIAAAICWFVRDERRERAQKLDMLARHYATAEQWRHRVLRRNDEEGQARNPAPRAMPASRSERTEKARKRFLSALAQG